MEPYDDTMEAFVDAIMQALDEEADLTQGYVDKLRHLVVMLTVILADSASHEATPEEEQVMRQALGYMDAKAGDAELAYLQVLQRCLAAIEKELFKWASAMVQPAGFSGESQIPVSGSEWEQYDQVLSEASRLRLTV